MSEKRGDKILKRSYDSAYKYLSRFKNLSFIDAHLNGGFSLVQTMIALGLVSVITVGLMRNQQTMVHIKTSADIATDINLWTNNITQVLFESVGCTETLNPVGALSPSEDTEVLQVINRSGNVLIDLTEGEKELSPGKLKITSLTITSFTQPTIVAPATTGHSDIVLTVNFLKKEKPANGGAWLKVSKMIPISASVDSSNTVVSCYDADENIKSTVLEQACLTMDLNADGIPDFRYDEVQQKCLHVGGFCVDGGSYISDVPASGDTAQSLPPDQGINPITGDRSCPAGFINYQMGQHYVLSTKRLDRTTPVGKAGDHTHMYEDHVVNSTTFQTYFCLRCSEPVGP